jgi:hypothetical protein
MYKRIRLLVSVLIHMKSVFVRELLLITRRQVMIVGIESLPHKKIENPTKKVAQKCYDKTT